MMGASEISIGGRPVSRIAVDGEVVWEKRKRYAYYFDGVNAYATVELQIIIASNEYPKYNFFGGEYKLVNEFGIEYEMLAQKSSGGYWRMLLPFVFQSSSTFYFAGRTLNGASSQIDISGNKVPTSGRHTMSINIGVGAFVDGTSVSGASPTFCCRILQIGGAPIEDAYNRRWHGYIYGITLDGESIDLQDIPGIKFHNVVRYELDRNGNIIESTATTLNDI